MLDLGSYPLHSIVDMFTFDLTTHLRYDILTLRGPVDRQLPPLAEAQLVPAVSWLLGGIPKMQPDLPQLDPTDIENWWREALLDVREAVRTGGLDQSGPAGGRYDECLFQHEPGQATVFVPVTTPRELGRIEPILVPAAEVAVTTHCGSTADIDLAHAELGSYIAGQELAVGPRIREYYHRDHTHTTDHTQWRTEVAWPIIDVLTPKA
jgi:effector-binding domain-containing protein